MPDEAPTHLVLGGSHGIGYAYAEYWAARGGSIILVARDADDLRTAESRLRSAGASQVRSFSGDLLNGQFRDDLFAGLAGATFATVLVSGPSPPAGALPSLGLEAFYRANDTCIVYPLATLHWLLSRPAGLPDHIFLISSEASAKQCHSTFFLSSLYRHALDHLVACLKGDFISLGAVLELWYPGVVRTRLAEQYARRIADAGAEGEIDDILSRHLRVERVYSAKEYVMQQLG